MSKPAVFALVDNEAQARAAVAQLEAAGFRSTDISILTQSAKNHTLESDPHEILDDEEGSTLSPSTKTREVAHSNTTKAPEGATTGVVTGGRSGCRRRLAHRHRSPRHSRRWPIHSSGTHLGRP